MKVSSLVKSFIGGVLAIAIFGCAGNSTYEVPDYKVKKLSNGLEVILVKDDSLPYFTVELLIHSGATTDPKGKEGLSSLTGQLLDKGTNDKTATEISQAWANLGGSFGVSVSHEFTFLSGSALSYYQDDVLDLFTEALLTPKFNQREINRSKRQTYSMLKRYADNPNFLASRAFQKNIYGNHPYGRLTLGKRRSLRKIKKKDIFRHYLRYYRPNNSTLAVIGKFDNNIMDKLESHLGAKWKPRKQKKINLPVTNPIKGRQITLVHKPGLKQSYINIGHFGIPRKDPDYLKLRVANTIFGGSTSSRLVEQVREKRGLTYHIGSDVDVKKAQGVLSISTYTEPKSTGKALGVVLEEFEKFVASGVTKEELSRAKGLINGTFPRALETAERLAENLLILKFYGVSEDYLQDYVKNINSYSDKDINAAIKRRYHPKNLKIVVFGNRHKVLSQLKRYGKVKVVSYKTIQ